MHKKDKILTSEQLETWIGCVTSIDAPKNCYECSMFVVAEVDGCDQVAFDHIRATMDSPTAVEDERIEYVRLYERAKKLMDEYKEAWIARQDEAIEYLNRIEAALEELAGSGDEDYDVDKAIAILRGERDEG
jgi:hypothetical protein